MANDLFSWLSLGVCMLLAVACLALYLDGRGQRKALGAAQIALGALQRQVAAQDEQIGHLTRALALLVPADARPTAPHRPGMVTAPHPETRRSPSVGRSVKPSAPEVYVVSDAAPETEGDRDGIIPGDPIPSESAEEIRARFEAEADARSQARLGLPSVALPSMTTDEPEDERTRVYSGRSRRRPTLLGGLAGAPPPPPPEDTLVSAGVARTGLDAGHPHTPGDAANDSGDIIVVAQREDGTPLSDREGPSA